jgi:acetyl esterase/lipase
VTTPGYATPSASSRRSRLASCAPSSSRAGLYSGHRDFLEDQRFATLSVASYVSESFPPALITVGDADPLRPHSELLVERLGAKGIEPETLFFPFGHEPPLGHEYQFDLDTEAGQLFLERMLSFLERRLRRTPREG